VTDPIDRVRTAFGDSYTIVREVGQGGMARVYLANDLKHERQVALKVLRPELAAAMGGDRLSTRDPDHREALAPAHPADARFGRGGRLAVLRHAVR
jgi:serine/threonine protein kinase